MPQTTLPPDQSKTIARLIERVERLERRTSQRASVAPAPGQNYWTYDGSTLQPDPVSVSPLDVFSVVADDGGTQSALLLDAVNGLTSPNTAKLRAGNGTDGSFILMDVYSQLFRANGDNVISMQGSAGASYPAMDFYNSRIDWRESATPSAPSANTARLFVRDNGGGKTQLAVLFNTGAVQVLATEP